LPEMVSVVLLVARIRRASCRSCFGARPKPGLSTAGFVYHLWFMRRLAIAIALSAGAVPPLPQSHAPRHALPPPDRTTRDLGELRAGVKWAAVTAIEPAPDGTIFVIHRCFANSCSGRPEAPILKFNAAGKLLATWGAGMFVFPHGATVDRDGNLWVTD